VNLKHVLTYAALAVALAASGSARAQDVALPEPAAQPPSNRPTSEGEPEIALDADREIDLANVVTSAAKGVTTVQEAPAIITIITSDEIKARGHKWLLDALATIPGWINIDAQGDSNPNPLVRGVAQAVLLMRDGMSMFEPQANLAWVNRSQPMETIKRIEVVTGPGGVLWGANSFLGIANLITKDAEDVNGLELSAGYGDGRGNKQNFKAYGLFGKTFLNGRLKIFQHASYETAIGTVYDVPQLIASSNAPQPGGIANWGKNQPVDPARSWWVMFDGKYTFGPVSLYYMVPFGDYHPNLTFANATVPQHTWTIFDRYGMLEYKGRYLKDRIGLTVKAYGTQFVRDYKIQLFRGSAFFLPEMLPDGRTTQGGLKFDINQTIFRSGATADLDFNLPLNIRILAGGEFFYEGVVNANTTFGAPINADNLPLVCPVDLNGMRISNCPRPYTVDTGRYVAAGYVDAQWRIFSKLTVDGGVRIQKGFGNLPYDLVPLGSASIVYNFLPDFHFKANYATGFRAPVIQNTSTVNGGIAFGANPNLQNERSQSFQGELNARVLRNVRKVRELELRADYSYTVLNNVIRINGGRYNNGGSRAIHSAEGYARLYLAGDHSLQAAYTYLYSTTSDTGIVRSMPNHWVSLGGSFNLIKSLLDVNFTLTIIGGYEDPNRYAAAVSTSTGYPPYTTGSTSSKLSDLTLDRLTPQALLQLGFSLRFLKDKLQFSAQFYNVLNQTYAHPDIFYDLTPTTEMNPTPGQGFNFFARLSYHF
jgi:outer membrane receptor protein involved in Fe transport